MKRIIIKSSLVGLTLLLGACTHHHPPGWAWGWDHDDKDYKKAKKNYHHDNRYKNHQDKHDD